MSPGTDLALGASAAVLGTWTLSWGAVATVAGLRAAVRNRNWRRTAADGSGFASVRVHLVRPCAGEDPGLADNLRSFVDAQRGDFRWTVSLTTGRADDPASAVCARVAAELREAGIEARARPFVLPEDVVNQKVGQLHRAERERAAQDDAPTLVVNVDSDVDLAGFDFGRFLAPLLGAATGPAGEEARGSGAATHGAVWAPPVEVCPETPADRRSAALLSSSLHAFGLLGALDPGSLVGKVFAVRSDALAETGGFESYDGWLGEDMELARRLHAAGWATRCVPETASSRARGRSRDAVVGRYARWLAVIRWQRPTLLPSYPLWFFPALVLAPAWGLLALAAWGTSASASLVAAALLGLAATVAIRVGLAAAARRVSRPRGARPSWGGVAADALRADLTLAGAFLRCLRTDHVEWRGRRLALTPGGRLGSVDAPTGTAAGAAGVTARDVEVPLAPIGSGPASADRTQARSDAA